jgi:imidazolonepropionase-like amidohydrolase
MHFEALRKSDEISGNHHTKASKHQRILTSKLFQVGPNGETLDNPWMQDATIVILKTNGRVLDVRPTNDEDLAALASFNPSVGCDESKVDVLDLRGLTILPGFIDTHVHCQYKDSSSHAYPLAAFCFTRCRSREHCI